jgi:peroxiredoxin
MRNPLAIGFGIQPAIKLTIMKYIFKTLVLLLLVSAIVSAQGPAKTIPEFSFFKLNKNSFTNKDLEPGKMLFFVFFDTDCDHCQHGMQYINQHYQEFKKTALYLITLDSQEKITGFMNKYGNNLKDKKNVTILQDPKYEFMRKFRPIKYPSIFLYSAKKELIMYDDNEQNLFKFLKQINKAG